MLAVGLAVTYQVWKGARSAEEGSLQAEFEYRVRDALSRIEHRMDAYEQVLYGVQGLFLASERVERDEFRGYVASLRLARNYPGIQGVGFSLIVPRGDLARHTAEIRRQGFPDYAIRPPGEREIYTSIVYLEPFADRNLRAFGYDMYSESVRRAAMESARDSGSTAISGKVRLIQEAGAREQAGFLMYVPIYRNRAPRSTVAERRVSIHGWAYSPFRMDDLMAGVLGGQITGLRIRIFDGDERSDATQMYDSNGQFTTSAQAGRFEAIRSLSIADSKWTLVIDWRPPSELTGGLGYPTLAALAGMGIAVLLALLTGTLVLGRQRALRAAQHMTRELAASERRAHLLLASTGEAIYGVNDKDECTFCNPACLKLLGYRDESELIGRNMHALIHHRRTDGSPYPVAECPVFDSLRTGQGIAVANDVFWRADGTSIEVEYSAHPLRHDDATFGSVIVFRDISERKRAEKARRRVQERLRLAVEGSGIALWDADATTGEVELTARWAQILGAPESAMHTTASELFARVHPEDRQRIRDAAIVVLKGLRDLYRQEHRVRAYEGGWRWILSQGRVIERSIDGRARRMIGINLDITERRHAEEELRLAQERLRTAIEALNDGFVLFDAEDRLVLCNERYREIYQRSADLLVPGARFEDIIRGGVGRGQYPEAAGREEAWIAERLAAHGRADSVIEQRLPDGRWMRIAESRTPQGGTVGFRVDITERKRAEDELRVAKETAELAARTKEAFLATMSHEIRTPLGGLLGMLEHLAFTPLNAEQRETLQFAANSGRGLLRIVNDILDWSKIEAGKLELSPQPTAVAGVVADVASAYARVASARGLVLEYRVDEQLSAVHLVDSLRLAQVLNNFVSNAVKFTLRGGRIEVRAELIERRGETEEVRFAVADNGIGIAKEVQERLFRSYSQAGADIARMYGGTGLGLAICQRLAELMQGRIGLESAPGRGSTFSLTLALPLTDALPLPLQATYTPQEGEPLQALGLGAVAAGAQRVLVVDDHPTNRVLLGKQLGLLGLRTEAAENGQEALALWRAGGFAAVITDCHMPVMDGYTLARAIRETEARESRPHTPVIAWTANALPDEIERCRAAGMDELLVKPTAFDRLRETLARWLPTAGTTSASAEQAPPEAQAPVLDAAALDALAATPAERAEILGDFLAQTYADAAELKAALANADLPAAAHAAHRMKGSSAMVGAGELTVACVALERAAQAGDASAAAAAHAGLQTALSRIQAQIAAPDDRSK